MNPINDGGPAFPHGPMGDSLIGEDGRISHQFHAGCGMSLRDWFAGQALKGQAHRLASPWEHRDILANDCYDIADAMIAARNGGKS